MPHQRLPGVRDKDRADSMVRLFVSGSTLQEIGEKFGITRERVRQIITKHKGLVGKSGGASTRAKMREAQSRADLDARTIKRKGCTYAQYRGLVAMGKGLTRESSPIGAYGRQRQNAIGRGIGWHLKLWDWWQIWQQSGKWADRGRGAGYCMARINDTGPYAANNVYITTNGQNIRAYQERKQGKSFGAMDGAIFVELAAAGHTAS